MKVLYVSHYSNFYGANKSLLQLILDLRDKYDVTPFVIVPNEGPFCEQLRDNDISFKIFRYYNWLNSRSFLTGQIIRIVNKIFFRIVFFSIKKQSFDIIHTNSSATSLGGYLSNKMKLPHLWHIREYGKEDCNLNYYMAKSKVGKYFEKNASLIISISEDLKKYYSQYIDPNKIQVIYNGIKKKEDFTKVLNTNKPLNICFLGLIHENKNQLEVLKALDYIKREKNTSDFILNIVGSCQDGYMDLLKTFIKKNNLEENVIFNGFVNDVDSFLKNIDLGVVSSKREAFGRVTIEFMINKIPVVACNTGANKEIINSKEVGYIYDFGKYKDLGDILYNFINDRDKIRIIGEKAYYRVINEFSSELNAKKVYDAYSNILSKT